MAELLFSHFHAAALSMSADGGLLLSGTRERMLAWGIVFCVTAAAALTCWLLHWRRRLALAGLLVALLIPVLVMPAARREHIHVLPSHIVVDSGAWLFPSRTIIDLRGLDHIRERQVAFKVAGFLVEPNGIWEVNYRDGRRRQVLLNGFFTAHRMAIAQYLRDRGRVVL